MLAPLQDWVAGYYHRDDAWSLAAHRRIFDAFPGPRHEVADLRGLEEWIRHPFARWRMGGDG